ncbi:hypothetical protein JG687_00011510 [Phytophthora cactorum]|uniref:Uncharacterized protein n=1 Tax=Phytophthora cactorum TaxID=29920 RepID=A0A329RZ43_9STRA|nr:hypothetical protein Pcac1_g16818 [Phytophthora cactorum]KAG2781773.1 hypothetical protein Pcac1_g8126 [Phytophthora cactorum]KAG2809325.1 hypothetical protein PC111_g16097 [Phytophthora cactorum]KAG2814878.1 hypothetical protein PC112_g14138 [Phytophthora cactorum]KAG2852530.1 hypothetical protein PC113_g14941 [Phytophthora cactorum]
MNGQEEGEVTRSSCLTGDVVGSVAPLTLRGVGEPSDVSRGNGTGQDLTDVDAVAVVGESNDVATVQDKDDADAVAGVSETSKIEVITIGETGELSPPRSGVGSGG